MSGTGIKEGQGITISLAAIAAVLNVLDISMDGVSVSDIDTSDQDTTGYKTYVASTLKEGGTVIALERVPEFSTGFNNHSQNDLKIRDIVS